MITARLDQDYELLKWKGPQEYQPTTTANFLDANERIQTSVEVEDEIKKMFMIIADIINDISGNIPAQKMMKKTNKIKQEPTATASGDQKEGSRRKFLSKLDKERKYTLTYLINEITFL